MKLSLSQLKSLGYSEESFAEAMEGFRKALEDHRFTKNGEPRPTPPHHWMEDCIKRIQFPANQQKPDDFVLDFEIVDDSPGLAERKAMLRAQIDKLEGDAVNAILSPGKLRLMQMDVNDALAKPDESRSPGDKAVLSAYTRYQDECRSIARRAALAIIEIDDLTDQTIDGFVPKI